MRWIDVPVRLDAKVDRDPGAIVARALGRATVSPAPARNDGSASALDAPIDDREAVMLTALADLAGPSPRAVKRFVSLYALARLDGGVHRGVLALMLALAQGGTADEKAAMAAALAGADPNSTAGFDMPMLAGQRLCAAHAAATEAAGAFSAGDAVAASRVAGRFSLAD